ncbi:MAG: hypothetical protein M1395_09785 [Bacteroidetes bacterium]|nr:hypothetical protein [Bacteroidota bacterium]
MRNLLVFAASLMFTAVPLAAQTSGFNWPDTFFSGYERTIHGGGFEYHSPNPSVTSSMLVRSSDSSAYYV